MAYYSRLREVCNVGFAADCNRVQRYKGESLWLNDSKIPQVEYFEPKRGDQPADLIIITTKWSGYNAALELIGPIVDEHKTIILPLLNGLLPYQCAVERYATRRVLRGFYVGSTASMVGSKMSVGGGFTTVMEGCDEVEKLFESAGLRYRVEEDMVRAQWGKLVVNVGLNQCSALGGGLSYGEIKQSEEYMNVVRELMQEAVMVAKHSGVRNSDSLMEEAMRVFDIMGDGDYSSMAQDVRSGRETEWEIFCGFLVQRANELGVEVPRNRAIMERLR